MPYVYPRPYVYSFCQMFQALRLFRSLDSKIFSLVSLSFHVQLIKSVCYLGNFVFPLMEESLSMYIYACDLSPRAVEMVKGQLISGRNVGAFKSKKNNNQKFEGFLP